jgi:cell fate regulator YaaT (PSP1 superfamily)
MGEVLCEATERAVSLIDKPTGGQILRKASHDDMNESSRMRNQERKEFEVCRVQIEQSKLPMRLVDVEHVFGGERVIVYYLAENRVDFRELVKKLASEFQTRIEMRQIGVRDEAKLLADYGDCGKPVCCNTHLSEMPPVSMKMAKLQRATLDPNKISGRCGRLKCCLRYEYDTYEQLQRELPPIGSDVVTRDGRARVLGHEILASQLLVSTEDRRRILIDAADVLTVIVPEAKKSSGARHSTREPSGGVTDQPAAGTIEGSVDASIPGDTDSIDTADIDTELSGAGSSNTEPSDTEPSDTEPSDTEPVDTESIDTELDVTEQNNPEATQRPSSPDDSSGSHAD